MPLLGRMRRAVHPAAAFIFISSAFILFTLYSFLGQTLDDTVKRLQPAEKLKSSHEFQDKVISDINVLQELELKFLPNFKNPCWYDQGTHLKEDDTNLYSSWLKPASALVLANYRNQRKDGHVLRCLPYFFLIGQPKCATTDVFQRINIHPDIAGTLLKGPHWWTRRRYGQPYAPRPVTFAEYLDLFSGAASDIEESTSSAGLPYHGKITGDGSTSTLWDSGPTMNYLYSAYNHSALEKLIQGFFILREGIKPQHNLSKQNFVENYESHNLDIEGCCFARQRSRDDYKNYERTLYKQNNSHYPGVVLAITAADVVHAMLPKAKIVAVIREPVSRLFSSYVFFTKKREKTPDSFEQDVMSSIRKWNTCIAHHSERTCAYNKTLHNDLEVRLYNGMYNIFLRDWMSVFPKEQILVLRMEDYHQDIAATMTSVYAHLGLRGLNANEERQMNMVPVQNKNRKKMNIGKILNSTEDILRKFYEEYNKDLADLLGDLRFTWDDYYNMA